MALEVIQTQMRHSTEIGTDGTHCQELRTGVVRQMFEHMLLSRFAGLFRTVSGADVRNTIDIEIGRSFGATDAIRSDHLVSLFLLALWRDK